jgi:hypothetical protein
MADYVHFGPTWQATVILPFSGSVELLGSVTASIEGAR